MVPYLHIFMQTAAQEKTYYPQKIYILQLKRTVSIPKILATSYYHVVKGKEGLGVWHRMENKEEEL